MLEVSRKNSFLRKIIILFLDFFLEIVANARYKQKMECGLE